MKLLAFFPVLFLLFSVGSQRDAAQMVSDNEFTINFVSGTTLSEVNAIAATWRCTVVSYGVLGPNQAVFDFNGTFPFTCPYESSESIDNLTALEGHIIEHEPGGD